MAEIAARWARVQEARSSAEARVERERMVGAIHDSVRRTIVGMRVPADAADDLANETTMQVLERMERGVVAPGHEDGYARRCAQNRARDFFRERSGIYAVPASLRATDEDLACHAPNAERLLVVHEELAEEAAQAARVARAVAKAPGAYRAVLEARYVRGEEIEAIVDRELAERGDDRVDAAARRRVRNAVDKRLERARNWLRARLVD